MHITVGILLDAGQISITDLFSHYFPHILTSNVRPFRHIWKLLLLCLRTNIYFEWKIVGEYFCMDWHVPSGQEEQEEEEEDVIWFMTIKPTKHSIDASKLPALYLQLLKYVRT